MLDSIIVVASINTALIGLLEAMDCLNFATASATVYFCGLVLAFIYQTRKPKE